MKAFLFLATGLLILASWQSVQAKTFCGVILKSPVQTDLKNQSEVLQYVKTKTDNAKPHVSDLLFLVPVAPQSEKVLRYWVIEDRANALPPLSAIVPWWICAQDPKILRAAKSASNDGYGILVIENLKRDQFNAEAGME